MLRLSRRQYLVAGDRWESMDPLVRSRLLLAPLFMRKRDLAELQPALAKLAAAGAADKCACGRRVRAGQQACRLAVMWCSLAASSAWRRVQVVYQRYGAGSLHGSLHLLTSSTPPD